MFINKNKGDDNNNDNNYVYKLKFLALLRFNL